MVPVPADTFSIAKDTVSAEPDSAASVNVNVPLLLVFFTPSAIDVLEMPVANAVAELPERLMLVTPVAPAKLIPLLLAVDVTFTISTSFSKAGAIAAAALIVTVRVSVPKPPLIASLAEKVSVPLAFWEPSIVSVPAPPTMLSRLVVSV